jgi:hypothetical protein
MALRTRTHSDLAWIGLLSSALVAGYLVVAHLHEPVGWARAHLHARFVIAVGYGHLFASVVGAPGRAFKLSARGLAATIALLLAYGIYTHACHYWRPLPFALLAVSAWHTFENDRAMRRARLRGRGGLGPLSPRPREHAVDVAKAAIASGLVLAVPFVWPALDPADVIVAFTLHHLVSWVVFVLARGGAEGRVRPTLVRLAGLHAPALGACVLAAHVLGHADAEPSALAPIARMCLDPATYLFWSAAHALHTAWRRRPRAGP